MINIKSCEEQSTFFQPVNVVSWLRTLLLM